MGRDSVGSSLWLSARGQSAVMVDSSGSVWTLKPFEIHQIDLVSKIKRRPKKKQPKFGRTETRETQK